MTFIKKAVLQRCYYYFPRGTFINLVFNKSDLNIKKDNYTLERYPPIHIDKVNITGKYDDYIEFKINENFSKDMAIDKEKNNFIIKSQLQYNYSKGELNENINIQGYDDIISMEYNLNTNGIKFSSKLKMNEYEFFRIGDFQKYIINEDQQEYPKFCSKLYKKLSDIIRISK